uniref:alanine transaminase n=1 Tax=Lygus hesperus TaxID=30085 RepID=A0A0A9XAS4_LYGHE
MQSTGAYTSSRGLQCIRQEVADFIYKRDGYPTHIDNIFLTDGASTGVKQWLQALITSPNDGIMCPIPQYPLYSAMLTLLNGHFIGYYMNEESGWGLDIENVRSVYQDAINRGITVRAISIINPGNPTGQSLHIDDIVAILHFAEEQDLLILVDEVYQDNIYHNNQFISFRKVLKDMKLTLPLVSFHSASKGYYGECG